MKKGLNDNSLRLVAYIDKYSDHLSEVRRDEISIQLLGNLSATLLIKSRNKSFCSLFKLRYFLIEKVMKITKPTINRK